MIMNKNRVWKNLLKVLVVFFYRLDVLLGFFCYLLLVDVDELFKNYGFEYYYIFKKFYVYKIKMILDCDEVFLIVNFVRKLLELFFIFKFFKG